LAVAATWTGDPAPTVTYAWGRCPPSSLTCTKIDKADKVQYAVTASDLGYRLAVEVKLTNKAGSITASTAPTAVVTAPPPVPPPAPPPAPQKDPSPLAPPPLVTNAPSLASTPPTSKAAPPALMRPFPVVRIRGYFAATGVRVTLLAVRGPRSAQISVSCVGPGCPVPTLALPSAPARLHAFERFLPAGTRLQVRIARRGRVGKYTSFLIRAHRAPLRTDRCLLPGRSRPSRCPVS
jgi:hypothetical protein